MMGPLERNTVGVLVVDDEVEILEEMMEAIIEDGWTVQGAVSVEEALIIMSEPGNIKVVITDLRMPGLTGIDLIDKLSEDKDKELEYIIVTGHDAQKHSVDIQISDAAAVLSKPVDINELLKTLQQVVQSSHL